jgi:hypothetical protein
VCASDGRPGSNAPQANSRTMRRRLSTRAGIRQGPGIEAPAASISIPFAAVNPRSRAVERANRWRRSAPTCDRDGVLWRPLRARGYDPGGRADGRGHRRTRSGGPFVAEAPTAKSPPRRRCAPGASTKKG